MRDNSQLLATQIAISRCHTDSHNVDRVSPQCKHFWIDFLQLFDQMLTSHYLYAFWWRQSQWLLYNSLLQHNRYSLLQFACEDIFHCFRFKGYVKHLNSGKGSFWKQLKNTEMFRNIIKTYVLWKVRHTSAVAATKWKQRFTDLWREIAKNVSILLH